MLSSNDDKRIQSIYSIETYAYRRSKDLEEIIINFDDVITNNIKEHNPKWPENPDYPRRISI